MAAVVECLVGPAGLVTEAMIVPAEGGQVF
jgi:hypothetical protein